MEILIWGDNMKRQISISIIFAIFLIILVWMYIKFYNENGLADPKISTEISSEKEEENIPISKEYQSFKYYIKDEQGKVVVYTMKKHEFYMETGIFTYTLPTEIQTKLLAGIFFETEAELYDFLESYSS